MFPPLYSQVVSPFIPRCLPFLKDHTAAPPVIYNALLYFLPYPCKETNLHHCPGISQDGILLTPNPSPPTWFLLYSEAKQYKERERTV